MEHNDFASKMCKLFDHWIVIEGHSLPYGSTSWCKKMNVSPTSQDGTIKYLKSLSLIKNNLHFYSHGGFFYGKDEQVNAGISILKQLTKKCYLWQVDVDEHWTEEKLKASEIYADLNPHKGYAFQFNQYVGEDIIAVGEWGSGYLNRLWKWNGEMFRSHEPALLFGQRSLGYVPEIKYDHFSYLYEKDVKFKSQYYTGHEYVHKGWGELKNVKTFPVHISVLFGKDSKIGMSNSYITRL